MNNLRMTRTDSRNESLVVASKAAILAGNSPNSSADLLDLSLTDIVPFRFNPRTYFDDDALSALAAHIRENGLITPLIVRLGPLRGRQKYDLVAGERRRRACLLAGLETAPCIVWEGVGHGDAICAALVENMMREDLSPMEVAHGLQAMLDLNIKKVDVAKRVARSPGYVSNHLKLLSLPHEIQQMLSGGGLTESLARTALVVISRLPEDEKIDPTEFMRAISQQPGASVHALERGEFPADTLEAFPALKMLAAPPPEPAQPAGSNQTLRMSPIGDIPPPATRPVRAEKVHTYELPPVHTPNVKPNPAKLEQVGTQKGSVVDTGHLRPITDAEICEVAVPRAERDRANWTARDWAHEIQDHCLSSGSHWDDLVFIEACLTEFAAHQSSHV